MPNPNATAEEADTLELDRPEGEADGGDAVQADDQARGEADAEGPEAPADDEQVQGDDGADDGVVVSIGDDPPEEEPEATGTPVIREIRRAQKEAVRALRAKEREAEDLKRQIEELRSGSAPAAGAADPVGPKPKLADYDYDDEKFAEAVESWVSRKARHDREQQAKADADRQQREAWAARLADYGKKKAEIPVKDFDDAEESVRDVLSVTQQGVILSGADNPALLVYALGKNPKKAKELAAITDPVRFAVAVGKLETQLKVTPRRTAPIPETRVRGSAPGAVTAKANLEKLREDALQSGDFSKYLAAKRAAGK